MSRPKVILRRSRRYDVDAIEAQVFEGLQTLDLKPKGRVLLKPNLVAAGFLFRHAYTRPEVAEGVLRALQRVGGEVSEWAIGERCGITIPTRYSAKEAGYGPVVKRTGAAFHYFEESRQVPIPLSHPGRLRDEIYTPEPVAKADFFVNVPKFKAHPWTTVTFSMKNYIGIQDDPHRLLDHDHRLNAKVSDLQYVLQPKLIVVDAIIAGEGRMLTPIPYDLNLLILGDNQLAVDTVCSHIAGVDPMEVEHLRLAYERGFGPIHLDDIEILGDVSLEAAQSDASSFRTGLIRVEDYFAGTAIRAYSGPPPGQKHDYCWGGCPGALEEAIEILRVVDRSCDGRMPPIHLVFGHYEGPIPAKEGERVVFIGDCAAYHGQIGDELVQIEDRYSDPKAVLASELSASKDIFANMAEVQMRFFKNRKNRVLRLEGCPVSVAEQVLALVFLGGLKNPYFDPRLAFGYTNSYLSTRTRNLLKRWQGVPYQSPDAIERGEARWEQSAAR